MVDLINTIPSTLPNTTKVNKINLWKLSTFVLVIILLGVSGAILFLKKEQNEKPDNTLDSASENPLYFSQQNFETKISQYSHAALSATHIINQQRNNSWQSLNCITSSEPRSYYNFSDIKKYITEETLIQGLQKIEDYKYKKTTTNDKNTNIEESYSQQEINYTDICKDDSNYYVLFLTMGQKNNKEGFNIVKEAQAGGGWLGQSNFAVISSSGDVNIFENINIRSMNIPIKDIGTGVTSTSREFAYYSCGNIQGKLGNNLYAFCGGEGGNGLFKIELGPISFTEISFCRWEKTGEQYTYACYNNQAEEYYRRN